MVTRIKNGRFLSDGEELKIRYLYYEDGSITAVTDEELPFEKEIDANGCYVSPGFIDVHLHGGGGFDFNVASVEEICAAVKAHKAHGTTTLYPTLCTLPAQEMSEALMRLEEAMKRCPEIGGVHIEGPYFSRKQCGAQNPECITPPKPEDYEPILERFGRIIKRWDYAPELDVDNTFLDALNKYGIVAAAGHTDAEYEDVLRAYEGGMKHITHLYSCTSTITRRGGFRILGVTESAYLLDDMTYELIGDGKHIPPELLRLSIKLKGKDKIVLITDALSLSAIEDSEGMVSNMAGVDCVVEDGVAKLLDRTAFAGSVATADMIVATCVKAGIPIAHVVQMLTANPARLMGLQTKGSLKKGYDADILIFDEDIHLLQSEYNHR